MTQKWSLWRTRTPRVKIEAKEGSMIVGSVGLGQTGGGRGDWEA